MRLATFIKQPGEKESYSITYEDALTAGDNVVSAMARVEPVGLTIEDVRVNDPVVRLWVSGGTDGNKYKVTITVTTMDGRILEDEITIRIKEY